MVPEDARLKTAEYRAHLSGFGGLDLGVRGFGVLGFWGLGVLGFGVAGL